MVNLDGDWILLDVDLHEHYCFIESPRCKECTCQIISWCLFTSETFGSSPGASKILITLLCLVTGQDPFGVATWSRASRLVVLGIDFPRSRCGQRPDD
jgi:hypothetical protein